MVRMTLAAVVALACAGPAYAQGFKLESRDIKPSATISEEQVFNGFGCQWIAAVRRAQRPR